MNSWDKKHISNLGAYQRRVDRLYSELVNEAVAMCQSLTGVDTSKPFRFKDYPQLDSRLKRMLEELHSSVGGIITNGVRAEWALANDKNSELARQMFGDAVGRLSEAQQKRYFSTNATAREAFIQRVQEGLNLSDRVWRYTEQFKEEIELGLDVGIRNGMSADQLSRELRGYLREPDRLFRRVRDERGRLQLSRNARAYHPGQGVYRSSYKNARRLAATETNIAYRTADYLRWQKLDFVVGFEIKRSNNPYPCPICEALKGRYPKDFKFTGWHPHCRCFAVPILADLEEVIGNESRYIETGERQAYEGGIDGLPEQFRSWVKDNQTRLARSNANGQLPYFIRDNFQVDENGGLHDLKPPREKSSLKNLIQKEIPPELVFNPEAYTQERKDRALWDRGDGQEADDALIGITSEVWNSATEAEKDSVYLYTQKYEGFNFPLRGIRGHSHSKSEFLHKVENLTSYIDRSPLPCDGWFIRGDTNIDAVFERVRCAGGKVPEDIFNLVGLEMEELGFMSTGSRDSSGNITKKVILKVYAPKGTKAAYIEPISDYGASRITGQEHGFGLEWDGVKRANKFGPEQETLFQRGTKMRIIKVERSDDKIFIDCEVIGQDVRPLGDLKDEIVGR